MLGQPAVAPAGLCHSRGTRDSIGGADHNCGQRGPRDRRVEHLAPEEEAAGSGMRDDDRDRQLDPLALVHRARVGEPEPVGVVRGELEDRVVGGNHQGAAPVFVLAGGLAFLQ